MPLSQFELLRSFDDDPNPRLLESGRPREFGAKAGWVGNRVYLKYLTSKTIADFSAFAIESKQIAPRG
jgi:hypothetical protein